MEYTEITLKIEPLMPFSDLLMYELGEIGYESFVNTDDGFKAYIPSADFDTTALDNVFANVSHCNVEYNVDIIPDQNWNAVWESTHEPVMVDDFCWVYAPFHGSNANAEYNILIEPKMSFGAAHHATTYMMISLLRDEDITNKTVLDMGSGTAVLAILAEMCGAKYVEAIDNDEWAYNNALENINNNNCKNIKAMLGDASILTYDKKFQIIMANINRNILLRDMKHYIAVLEQGGTLLLSGFYEHDIPAIRHEAENNGMKFETYKERSEWVACKFTKQ